MNQLLTRRALVKGACALGALALLPPGLLHAAPIGDPETIDLAVSPTRSTKLLIWKPASPRGVVLFSTGHGSWPERYARLISVLLGEGFVVLAPLHVDSMHYPEREKFTFLSSFTERLADMRATAAHAARAFPVLPVIAAGHSYGTLTSLCLGGALPNFKGRIPAVKAVLGFSSPGKQPGLVPDSAYSSVQVPVMMVTGTADALPPVMGHATPASEHLFPAETAPAGTYALVVEGGDHQLVDDAVRFPRTEAPVKLFVEAYGLGDAGARRKLDTWKPSAGDRWTLRKAQA
ncbi:alpha-beta hydrolase superfamily lysophospholipase [Sphingomonas kyeonggiensis]|uniref:Alpha-beta hydrolase superfamily lysophospholipase n=1 Tax=Sphingomonas kyeonggiensis TaxID=1268553 RepID=A0A7W7NRJ4_9SPHN|nr:alpha/beta hydrolase [Sphingomonas kyeonggiensis]MBB4837679.1 alpha-beta hydrolase superfamily lysophospholipase [Sphingomonas kyeonggiensis]